MARIHAQCLRDLTSVIGDVEVWVGGLQREASCEELGALPTPLPSLSASAKSCLALLSQRPSSQPGHATCTQPCPQPPEPGEGAPDPQDHPDHEVRFPREHSGPGNLSPCRQQACVVKDTPDDRQLCRSPSTPSAVAGEPLISQVWSHLRTGSSSDHGRACPVLMDGWTRHCSQHAHNCFTSNFENC